MKILSDQEIQKISDPIVDTPEDFVRLYEVFLCMCKLCLLNNGVGLAAIQVGIPWRMFIRLKPEDSKHPFDCFVNCEYIPKNDEKSLSVEGCLSLRRLNGELRFFEVNRYKIVRLKGHKFNLDLFKFDPIEEVLEDFAAIVVQHEIDHASRILISDIGKEIHVY